MIEKAWFCVAFVVFVAEFFISAPYGKHAKKQIPPMIAARYAWVLMEILSPALMLYFFIIGPKKNLITLVLYLVWQTHYVNRTFIFPMRLGKDPKPVPLVIVLSGAGFNLVNASLNGIQLFFKSEY